MTLLTRQRLRRAAMVMAFAGTALLNACGGGGGSPGFCFGSYEVCNPGAASSSAPPASDTVAEVCTLAAEKQFTRSYLDEVYLWYDEIPNISASVFDNVPQYFYNLLTRAKEANGQDRDRFSFIVSLADADSLSTGVNVGYGVRWEADGAGRQRAAFVDAGSPAAAAGLARGGELVQVLTPGTPIWYPNAAGSISFVYRSTPSAATRGVTLTAATFTENPVPLEKTLSTGTNRKVGYLLFNAHTIGAQDKLIGSITQLKAQGIADLVLDLRYNGGGFLYTALALDSMIAGPGADGRVFEQLQFNNKRAAETADAVFKFSGTVQYGESQYAEGTPLPRLDLPRVYVLTSAGTCSASESVVNGLRGVGVDVVLIGNSTCGKPYGFSRRDNCTFSYFPVEFKGVNALGTGDYISGFTPFCKVADDFDNALGAPTERQLAAALHHIDNGTCPPAASAPQAAPLLSAVPNQQRFTGKLLRRR